MISIEYLKGLPIDYESYLVERYNSYLTTCRYIEIYYPTCEISYILVREEGDLIDLLVFGNEGKTSMCFNSLVEIDQNIIIECTKRIFQECPAIKDIVITSSFISYSLKRSILLSKSNDHIIKLPSSMDEYYSALGYHTRKNSRNRKVRLLRDYSDVQFYTKFGSEIDEVLIDKILELNIDRMKSKGIIPGSDKDKNKIFRYSQYYGCVAYIEIDGVLVAGFIATILEKRLFGHVIAHDNNFSKYNLGEICQFYLIQTAIDKGLTAFHYSWGENEYKKRLLANPHLMFSYSIYKAYSFDYFYTKMKVIISQVLTDFRLSKYSKPLRDAIKNYRKKKWKVNEQLNNSDNL